MNKKTKETSKLHNWGSENDTNQLKSCFQGKKLALNIYQPITKNMCFNACPLKIYLDVKRLLSMASSVALLKFTPPVLPNGIVMKRP